MSTLAEQLLHLFPSPISDVFVGTAITEKKLAGARSYAQWGQEVPLIVFDNTVFGSAKNGAVFTTHALYVDTHPQRIDLADIRAIPRFTDLDGSLPLPYGSAKLPKMHLDEAQDAFVRVFEVIVGWNTGTLARRAADPPVEGPIGQLALQCFTGTKLDIGGRSSRRKLANAAAASAAWLDTLAGERIVAYGDETAMGKGDEFVLLTDRRLLAHVSDEVTEVPYAHVIAARAQKVTFAQKLVVDMHGRTAGVELATLDNEVVPIAHFLQTLASLPPDHRWAPSPPLETPQDPSGATALAQRLPVPDPRLPILLRLVQAGLASGKMSPAAARDHVERARIFAANEAFGRGVSQGMRVSPLFGDDLAAVLGETLGPPVNVTGDQATRTYDFHLRQGGSIGRAAASSAVGLAALAIVGVGWVSTPGSRTTAVRVVMRHLGSATGFVAFSLAEPSKPLGETEPELFASMLETLAEAEPTALLGRILWGWQAPSTTLLATPPQAFTPEVTAAIGWTDLTPFFAPAD